MCSAIWLDREYSNRCGGHIALSHHFLASSLLLALIYAPASTRPSRWPGTDNPARPQLHVPPGARATFRRVVGAWGNEDLIEKAFDLREYEASSRLDIGPLQFSFQPVPHFTETYAMCICSSEGPGRIIYGADSSPTKALNEFASDADLILVEATLPRPERNGKRGHLTPGEAGLQARATGARRLLLGTSRTNSTPDGPHAGRGGFRRAGRGRGGGATSRSEPVDLSAAPAVPSGSRK